MNTRTHRSLWRAWRTRGDGEALATLLERELPYAADLARRRGASHHEAEDVVQDVVSKLAREASDTPIEVGVRAWICRRVVLGVRMHIRGQTRRRRYEQAPRYRPPQHHAEDVDNSEQVERALGALSGDERTAVVMRYLHDLEYREMAHALGLAESTCRVRVHRALSRLRKFLGENPAARVALLGIPPMGFHVNVAALTATGTAAATATVAAKTGAAAWSAKSVAGVAASAVGGVALAAAIVARQTPPAPAPPPQPAPVVVAAAPPAAVVPPVVVARPKPEPPPVVRVPQRTADAFQLMDDHLAGKQDAEPTLWSFDRLVELGERPAGKVLTVEARADVTVLDLEALSEHTRRVHLGPGVFRVATAFDLRKAQSVELVGAGPNKTFVQVPTNTVMNVRAKLRGTAWFRDLTFEGDVLGDRASGRVVDARGPCIAFFERVRFRAWDDRAGYGAPLGISSAGRLLLALRDCSFVGGYRRRMGGEAVAVRSSTLQLFERCRFYDMAAAFSETNSPGASTRSRGLFLDCRFENTPLSMSRTETVTGRRGPYPVHVRGGEVLVGGASDAEPARRRRWNEARALSVTDVRFSQAPVRATLVDLRKVVERFRPPGDEQVVGVEVLTWHECPKPFYVVHSRDSERNEQRRVVQLSGRGVQRAWLPYEPVRHRLPAKPVRGARLATLLQRAWARLDLEASVHSVAIHQTTRGNAVLQVNDRLN